MTSHPTKLLIPFFFNFLISHNLKVSFIFSSKIKNNEKCWCLLWILNKVRTHFVRKVTGILTGFCFRFTFQFYLKNYSWNVFPILRLVYIFFCFCSNNFENRQFYDYVFSALALVLKVNQSKSRLLKRDFDSSSNQKRIKSPETLLKHECDSTSWDMYDVFSSVRK